MLTDPSNGDAALAREHFRAPPKTRGAGAEEEHSLQSVTDAEVLLRLQNNLKLRAFQRGDGARAIEIARRMALVTPRRPEWRIGLAHLNDAEGALSVAHKAHESCLTLTKSDTAFHNEAALGLQELKRRLN